ncbi:uncharacterized protein [Eurosta solidaginis]|uniref:uncharacterized protein n=1 Tax=Eurosta solidaginis TaxID=178769 RepID=UPI003530EA89
MYLEARERFVFQTIGCCCGSTDSPHLIDATTRKLSSLTSNGNSVSTGVDQVRGVGPTLHLKSWLVTCGDTLHAGHTLYASKGEYEIAYAIVNSKGQTMSNHIMQPTASIFTAEAAGILEALEMAQNYKKKAVIFSDSLSVIEAVKYNTNTNWNTINAIRDILHQSPQNKLFWIPEHVGITGNEKADIAARSACKTPTITSTIVERLDFLRFSLKQHQAKLNEQRALIQHYHYFTINPNKTPAIYPTKLEKNKIVTFSRLRLGHTNATHSHLLNTQNSGNCLHCNTRLTVSHLLLECPIYQNHRSSNLNNQNPINLLKSPTTENINTVYSYIRAINTKI